MLEMVLSFIGQAVAVVISLGLVFLGAAIVSAICDWENFEKSPK